MPLLLPLLLAVAPAGPTLTADDLADARCLVAFSLLPPDADGKASAGSVLGSFYYYGKLVGRHADLDLEAALRTVAPDMKTGGEKYLEPCRQELLKRSQMMMDAGKALTAAGL